MREVAALGAKLPTVRTGAGRGRRARTALEGRLGEESVRSAEARRTAAECEQRLEQARAERGGALREDAYRHAQNAANAIARELAETIERFLAVLAAYEGARGAVADARSQLAPSVLARLGPYDVP